MAHGTGLYWERRRRFDVQTDEYVAYFKELLNYYYPDMSDCYEPSCESRDEYMVVILKWRDCKYGGSVADHLSPRLETKSISKDEANKIWWNIKNRKPSFNGCLEYFNSIGILDEHESRYLEMV